MVENVHLLMTWNLEPQKRLSKFVYIENRIIALNIKQTHDWQINQLFVGQSHWLFIMLKSYTIKCSCSFSEFPFVLGMLPDIHGCAKNMDMILFGDFFY